MSDRFAVIIGVDDYTQYALATDARVHEYDLLGPTQDVLGWFGLFRRLGYDAGCVRVLSTDRGMKQQLQSGGVVARDASHGQLTDAREWLVGALRDCEGPVSATVVFSGHGDALAANGGAVFPADYVGTAESALFLTEWAQAIDDLGRDDVTLTVFVDACREGGAGLIGALPEREGPSPADYWSTSDHILMSACASGQLTRSRCLDGTWRSVFSWVVDILTSEWTLRDQPGVGCYVTVSYADLLERSRAMIAAMSSEDDTAKPVLIASEASRALGFGQPPGSAEGETFENPDAWAPGHELPANNAGTFMQGPTWLGFARVGPNPSNGTIWGFTGTTPLHAVTNFTFDFQGMQTPQTQNSVGHVAFWSAGAGLTATGSGSVTALVQALPGTIMQALEVNGTSLTWYRTPSAQTLTSSVSPWTQQQLDVQGWAMGTDQLVQVGGGYGGNPFTLDVGGAYKLRFYREYTSPNLHARSRLRGIQIVDANGTLGASVGMATSHYADLNVSSGFYGMNVYYGQPSGLVGNRVRGVELLDSSGGVIASTGRTNTTPFTVSANAAITTLVGSADADLDSLGALT